MGWRSGEDDRTSGDVSVDANAEKKPRRPRAEPTPTQRALGLLVRREHSRRELTRKLAARGVERDDATAAIDKLEAAGWQDDGRFAEALVRSRVASGYGPVRIRAELGTHALEREAIAAALETAEIDWDATARDLVRRRFGDAVADDRNAQRKAADWLMRRGFTGAQVRAATRFDPED
ncbi:recombination regulator RecX [Lysobacter sp. A6]|uniref:Regulatory protein RecX n=1 Tax=Noviluteimonas lactosilytica TaxID=2888523 RepID=A0ABS8JIZ3_9GAMM|nr:recombination regulator RecX [Lysobacter lactosilyticus]MCC8363574.1 recombination regulator RecX [Lysobacter lactosilyticus]